MLPKNTIRNVKNLHQKKFRKQTGQFIVEGEKLLQELLASEFRINQLYCTEEGLFSEAQLISGKDLERISALKSPNKVLAVVQIPDGRPNEKAPALLLDGVNDPGNLGTIIRIADWYGINQVVCSKDAVDVYNPKTVQASMGSIFRVRVYYEDLPTYLHQTSLTTYAAVMDGDIIQQGEPSFNLLMGSESHGVRNGLDRACQRITIQRKGKAESLNVGVACGIILEKLSH